MVEGVIPRTSESVAGLTIILFKCCGRELWEEPDEELLKRDNRNRGYFDAALSKRGKKNFRAKLVRRINQLEESETFALPPGECAKRILNALWHQRAYRYFLIPYRTPSMHEQKDKDKEFEYLKEGIIGRLMGYTPETCPEHYFGAMEGEAFICAKCGYAEYT